MNYSIVLKRILICTIVLLSAPVFNNETKAQGALSDTVDLLQMWYNYQLTAYSHSHPTAPTGNSSIYDDFRYVQYIAPDYADPKLWNCGRTFLFTTYTAPTDTIGFYLGSSSMAIPLDTLFDMKIYIDGFSTLAASYSGIPVYDSVNFSSTTSGLYDVFVLNHGTRDTILSGNFILIPKVKRLWIEASPVCSGGTYLSGTYYNFKLNTDPALSTFINKPVSLGTFVASGGALHDFAICETIDPYDLRLTIAVSDMCTDLFTVWDTSLIASDIFSFDLPHRDDSVYRMAYSGLAPVLSGGSCYGQNININANFTDAIVESLSVNAPLIIETPAAAPGRYYHPDTTPYYYPPQASGTPSSAYDFYNYTISDTEVWSPAHNPLSAMNGDALTNTISILNNLNILPGGSLTLDSMTLQFGPAGTLTVRPAPASTSLGGFLALFKSTLTAYRGCDGTEHSTWHRSGVHVAWRVFRATKL